MSGSTTSHDRAVQSWQLASYVSAVGLHSCVLKRQWLFLRRVGRIILRLFLRHAHTLHFRTHAHKYTSAAAYKLIACIYMHRNAYRTCRSSVTENMEEDRGGHEDGAIELCEGAQFDSFDALHIALNKWERKHC